MYRFLVLTAIIFSLLFSCITTDEIPSQQKDSTALELDSQILKGTLPNGLTYYIRNNSKPEKRAELRLVVNAGSILEDDTQRGIAHFLEHLAFNGTLHFKKNSLVDYLESIGMRFGSDLNASTNYDETIYRLQVPTDEIEKLETGLLILEDWAHNITIEPEEVEKERKVIIEEWRSRSGAEERIRDKHLSDAFAGSKYVQRRPIGDIKTIETVTPETIKKFYTEWYRPELMAVIVVGDVDPEMVKNKIEQQFGSISAVNNPRPREYFYIPENTETIISIAADKEATSSSLKLFFKQTPKEVKTATDYRSLITQHLFFNMINSRLTELSHKPNSPFIDAYAGGGRFVRTMDVGMIAGVVKEHQIEKGLESILIEIERIKKHGFVYTELQRSKQNALSAMQQSYNNRDKRESSQLASEYIRNYLEKESVPGIEKEYELYEAYIPGITLDEMNGLADSFLNEKNRFLLVAAPEIPDLPVPSEEKLRQLFSSIKKIDIQPYVDETVPTELVAVPPKKGEIVNTVVHKEMDITELILSNGIHVLLKKTDFNNDEIAMRAFSPGGLSLVSEDNYIPGSTAASLISTSGAAGFSRTQLEKILAGKQVQVVPYIDELFEGFSGASRTQDIKEMFELIHLYFTAPYIDKDAFTGYKEKLATALSQKNASPENVFWDTVKAEMANNHPRSLPWTLQTVELLDIEKSLAVYRQRFKNAEDFTFVFVGDFEIETLKPLIETFLASLPGTGKIEKYKDLGMDPAKGKIRKELKLGVDPKSFVQIIFHGDFDWNLDEVVTLGALSKIVDMRMTDSIREDAGGTYGISAWDYPKRFPKQQFMFFIGFGCDPARADQLTSLVYEQIKILKDKGINTEELNTVKQILTKEREVNLTQNGLWAELIKNYRLYNMPFTSITDYFKHIDSLSIDALNSAAQKYLSGENSIEVILFPKD